MRYPWANTILLLLLLVQAATGLGGLLSGSERFGWVMGLHGAGGYALAVLLWWKGAIIWNVLRRRRLTLERAAFVVLALLLAALLATGFLWSYAGPRGLGGYSLLVLHGALAAVLVPPLLWHLVARRWIVRVRASRDRRAFLRGAAIGVAGAALWRAASPVKAALGWRAGPPRFTGSYERGSLTGDFPTTSWLFDAPAPLDGAAWRLVVEGAVARPFELSLEALRRLPTATVTETLDCTGGWYSTQRWEGVRLSELLAQAEPLPGARSVTVEGVTGYGRRFALHEAGALLLATHVAGQPLSHGHGAPLRLVAGGRRGYDWVKWVVRLRVNESGAQRQPPLPLR